MWKVNLVHKVEHGIISRQLETRIRQTHEESLKCVMESRQRKNKMGISNTGETKASTGKIILSKIAQKCYFIEEY